MKNEKIQKIGGKECLSKDRLFSNNNGLIGFLSTPLNNLDGVPN